jgi:hypothetical protein
LIRRIRKGADLHEGYLFHLFGAPLGGENSTGHTTNLSSTPKLVKGYSGSMETAVDCILPYFISVAPVIQLQETE